MNERRGLNGGGCDVSARWRRRARTHPTPLYCQYFTHLPTHLNSHCFLTNIFFLLLHLSLAVRNLEWDLLFYDIVFALNFSFIMFYQIIFGLFKYGDVFNVHFSIYSINYALRQTSTVNRFGNGW